jgi:hypothetical protein
MKGRGYELYDPFSVRTQPGTANVAQGGAGVGGLSAGLPLCMSQLRLLPRAVVLPVNNCRQPTARTRATGQCTLVTSGLRRTLGAGSGVVEVRVHRTLYAEDSQPNAGVGNILSAVVRLAPGRWRWSRGAPAASRKMSNSDNDEREVRIALT